MGLKERKGRRRARSTKWPAWAGGGASPSAGEARADGDGALGQQFTLNRAALAYSNVGVIVFGADGRILEALPPYPPAPGYDLEQVRATPTSELVHPDDFASWQAAWGKVLADPADIVALELRARYLGGPWKPVRVAMVNALADPQVRGVVATLARIDEPGTPGSSVPVTTVPVTAATAPAHPGPPISPLMPAVAALAAAPAAAVPPERLVGPSAGDSLPAALSRALVRHEFLLQYQPVVDLRSGYLVGAEALLRWARPGYDLLPPSDYLEVAEQSGLIVPLGSWALREACQSAAEWSVDGYVAVNLAAAQLADPQLVATVRRALDASGLTPCRLVVEVTESTLILDTTAARLRLQALRDLGVRVAVDDFGMGYSSLAYLRQLPVDLLKIDRFFVDGLGRDSGDGAIVAAVINLAHELGLEVVAEGVERPVQAEELVRLGCHYAQGYLYGHPGTVGQLQSMRVAAPGVPG